MVAKSERLKKLETELKDLEQWLKLGLVPKAELEKHTVEIESLRAKITEEEDRLRSLKESGDPDEFVAPKRPQGGRQAYQEAHTLPGIDVEGDDNNDTGVGLDTESYDTETTMGTTEEKTSDYTLSDEDEEDPFSDKNRWKRGILEDPDGDNW